MRVTVSKWGNSLGLRIPRSIAEDARLAEGVSVELHVENGLLVVELVPELDALLDRITPENSHGDTFAARPAGGEAL